jgi:hypothetical protein
LFHHQQHGEKKSPSLVGSDSQHEYTFTTASAEQLQEVLLINVENLPQLSCHRKNLSTSLFLFSSIYDALFLLHYVPELRELDGDMFQRIYNATSRMG